MLGRRALCSLLRSLTSSARIGGGSGVVVGRRGFADCNALATATNATHQDFIASWMKVAPNIEPPKTQLTFMKLCPAVSGSIPTKVTINFILPYQVELSNKEVTFKSLLVKFKKLLVSEREYLFS